jgi:DNA-3-methyladenine glycosylase
MRSKKQSLPYHLPTIKVAKALLGSLLVHDSPQGKVSGRIVETEAYLHDDPACHASRGMTPRTKVMFGPPGHAYIYFIYGMYHCLNVVTGPEGCGEAVLIRALEPVDGIELMQERRPRKKLKDLCNGPGKLVIALGIPSTFNGIKMDKWPLKIIPAKSKPKITTTTRIGITKGAELPLRFYIPKNPFVSRKS